VRNVITIMFAAVSVPPATFLSPTLGHRFEWHRISSESMGVGKVHAASPHSPAVSRAINGPTDPNPGRMATGGITHVDVSPFAAAGLFVQLDDRHHDHLKTKRTGAAKFVVGARRPMSGTECKEPGRSVRAFDQQMNCHIYCLFVWSEKVQEWLWKVPSGSLHQKTV
jgi:hypothetical protein